MLLRLVVTKESLASTITPAANVTKTSRTCLSAPVMPIFMPPSQAFMVTAAL